MRVYLVVKHRKKEDNPIVLHAYQDKKKAKAKSDELDNAVPTKKKKKIWHTIEKFDVVDTECLGTQDSTPSP